MAIFRDLKPDRELVDTIPHAWGRNGHIGISRRGSPPTWREAKRRQDKGFHSVLLSFWGPWLHFTRIAVWALGAGYFWIVTIDVLVIIRCYCLYWCTCDNRVVCVRIDDLVVGVCIGDLVVGVCIGDLVIGVRIDDLVIGVCIGDLVIGVRIDDLIIIRCTSCIDALVTARCTRTGWRLAMGVSNSYYYLW